MSKVRIEFREVQQYFFNKEREPLHVLASDYHYWKMTSTSKEMLHMYYVHVLSCKG
jgi:hypothetical protein